MMIVTREMATAYLTNGNDILLMKRADNRSFAPGIWAGVGGHAEPEELNRPYDTCVREIFEETGISAEHIRDLRLQFIILRRCKNEIRIQYVYFGASDIRNVIQTDEGILYWIDKNRLLEKNLSVTSKLSLQFFLNNGPSDRVMVGTVYTDHAKPAINWCPVEDWEGM